VNEVKRKSNTSTNIFLVLFSIVTIFYFWSSALQKSTDDSRLKDDVDAINSSRLQNCIATNVVPIENNASAASTALNACKLEYAAN